METKVDEIHTVERLISIRDLTEQVEHPIPTGHCRWGFYINDEGELRFMVGETVEEGIPGQSYKYKDQSDLDQEKFYCSFRISTVEQAMGIAKDFLDLAILMSKLPENAHQEKEPVN